MFKARSEATIVTLARENGLHFGHSAFGGDYYAGTPDQLRAIGVVDPTEAKEGIPYKIVQNTTDGQWISCVQFSPDDHHIRQTIIAGFLLGQPRRAVDLQGKTLFALDARGNNVVPTSH